MSTAIFAEPPSRRSFLLLGEPMETDDALYEVVHGRRVEMPPMSIRAVMIASRIWFSDERVRQAEATRRGIHGVAHPLAVGRGRESGSTSRCLVLLLSWLAGHQSRGSRRQRMGRHPRRGRRGDEPLRSGRGQREKVLEYFRAGVRSVWVVYPNFRVVDVYETPTSVRVLVRTIC